MPHGKKPTRRHVVQETIKTRVVDPETGRMKNEVVTIHYGFPKKTLGKMVKEGLAAKRKRGKSKKSSR